jgi:hypothetical protein
MNHQRFSIHKSNGLKEAFSKDKLFASLRKSGVSDQMAAFMWQEIQPKLMDGMTTHMIYQWVYNYLREHTDSLAARYKLKKAFMELGPSGYPFEQFVSKILEKDHFKVQTSIILQGHCVQHEVDVIADKGNVRRFIECKYHNKAEINCDVKIPLYIHSRFNDLVLEATKRIENKTIKFESWIYTNTAFSIDAIQYAQCNGIHLVGWNFPLHKGLNQVVDFLKLYPITCLTTITDDEKRVLLDKNIVLVEEILDKSKVLRPLSLSEQRRNKIMNECLSLTQRHHA